MILQENSSGKPLADTDWLESHHQAKLIERTAFAKRLAALNPKSVVDLGCATGLWLELLNQLLPPECIFFGIDSDKDALNLAAQRSNMWERDVSYLKLDLEHETSRIPAADLTLAFNVFPYIQNLEMFINVLSCRSPRGILAVRQYDGASIRFGPMNTADRQNMEQDLRLATENSSKFYHYDLDRTFKVLHDSSYQKSKYEFELFERSTPFPDDFLSYYHGTLQWTSSLLSQQSAERLSCWVKDDSILHRYFYEVDLVALLS